ncbi:MULTISPECIES: sensor histidine kinase [unclassified Streptomyces]|uniref:sensor histidine kinase n=1 Tax=unclassified Streptomyces TaxID=2593676 RepID=UPI001E44F2D9|nr:histidine kinase [Streptomyces sp. CB02980]MCB8907564.1 histidine kinase [Streptomyces sp. CB02980]
MIKALRPLLRRSTYTGALFAYSAALASLPLLSFALLPALAWRSAPEGLLFVVVLVVWAALIALVGLARTTRRVLILAARRLLYVVLPEPSAVRPPTASPEAGPVAAVPGAPSASLASPTPPASDRWRTPLWLLLHVTLGWTGALASGLLLFLALALPGGWLRAELALSLFGRSARVTGGWQSWAVALGCLLLAAVVCVLVTRALRWSAPRLLGPSTAERLALAAERERRLAERNRLAHELHDSIGHTLTTTTIQAAVAGELMSTDPAAARAALRSIEESARAALEDLDYVLGVLREREAETAGTGAAGTAGTAPTRTLADLPELLERVRHTGAVVEWERSGDPAQVRGTLSRAAYRIIQEGLTNAVRHGAGGPITVRVTAGPDALELAVVNETGASARTGRPRAFPTSGHGLPGLAERVRLLHGEIDAGPDGPRRWRLAVRLPVRLSA